jgi:hypothetical protein
MKKDSKTMSQKIQEIMEEELAAQGQPSLRKFTDWLSESLSKAGDGTLSHNTIANWQNGKPPSTDILEDLLAVYPASDRRFLFALKLLAIKSPHVWGPDGIVWSLNRNSLPKAG